MPFVSFLCIFIVTKLRLNLYIYSHQLEISCEDSKHSENGGNPQKDMPLFSYRPIKDLTSKHLGLLLVTCINDILT